MGWKILGVFVGVVTDISVSLAVGLIFGIMLAAFFMAQHGTAHDFMAHPKSYLDLPVIKLANAGLGSFGSLVGGFVTGWIAGSSRVLCGIIMGCCSVLASIPFWSGEPVWFNVLGVALTVIMATGGSFVAEAFLGRKVSAA